jgi:3-oxoacyl-[acyl-carrier protein] reductase
MGRSHALALAARGANVVVADIERDGAEATAKAVRSAGVKSHALVADVREIARFRAALAEAIEAIGPIDILVNNAGVGGERLLLADIDEAAFDRMFGVHVKGAFFAAQAVAPGMAQRGWGRIVNVSSQFGVAGSSNASHYAGAKAALLGFTKTWARELAPRGVTVNAVAPGYIDTQMTARTAADPARLAARLKTIPVGRKGEPEDVSHAVLWLVSDEASFVTGQVLSPNGGETIV